ncbi:MAG: AI-2E family transporter [Chloroflexota bacterium]
MKNDTQWSLTFRYVAGILFFAAFIAFLFYAHDAVRNLVIAGFVAYLINPAVMFLSQRTRISRTVAVNIVYFSAVILLVGVPATLTPIFYDEVQTVIQDVLDLSKQISALLSRPVHIGNLVFHLESWGKNLSQMEGSFLTPLPDRVLKLLETTSVGALWFIVVLVTVYLLLNDWPQMRNGIYSFALPPYRAELEELYKRIRRVWMAYLRGQIVLMIIVGVVFTIAWTVMGIPGALVLGVLAGLFTLVPDVGPFLAAALAVGVALLEGSTWIPLSNFWVAAIAVAVYLVLIGLKNFFVRPIIMGRSVHINEGIVFIAIVVGTILEGILGALLIVPVLASVVVIASYIQRKVLGLPAFEDDGSMQFVAPPELIKSPRRGIRRDNRKADDEPASDSYAPASASSALSNSKTDPARKKTKK